MGQVTGEGSSQLGLGLDFAMHRHPPYKIVGTVSKLTS